MFTIHHKIVDRNIGMTALSDRVRVRTTHYRVVMRVFIAVSPRHVTIQPATISTAVAHHA